MVELVDDRAVVVAGSAALVVGIAVFGCDADFPSGCAAGLAEIVGCPAVRLEAGGHGESTGAAVEAAEDPAAMGKDALLGAVRGVDAALGDELVAADTEPLLGLWLLTPATAKTTINTEITEVQILCAADHASIRLGTNLSSDVRRCWRRR